MRVALVDCRVGRQKVKVAFAIGVPHKHALGTRQHHRQWRVVVGPKLILPLNQLRRVEVIVGPAITWGVKAQATAVSRTSRHTRAGCVANDWQHAVVPACLLLLRARRGCVVVVGALRLRGARQAPQQARHTLSHSWQCIQHSSASQRTAGGLQQHLREEWLATLAYLKADLGRMVDYKNSGKQIACSDRCTAGPKKSPVVPRIQLVSVASHRASSLWGPRSARIA